MKIFKLLPLLLVLILLQKIALLFRKIRQLIYLKKLNAILLAKPKHPYPLKLKKKVVGKYGKNLSG